MQLHSKCKICEVGAHCSQSARGKADTFSRSSGEKQSGSNERQMSRYRLAPNTISNRIEETSTHRLAKLLKNNRRETIRKQFRNKYGVGHEPI